MARIFGLGKSFFYLAILLCVLHLHNEVSGRDGVAEQPGATSFFDGNSRGARVLLHLR